MTLTTQIPCPLSNRSHLDEQLVNRSIRPQAPKHNQSGSFPFSPFPLPAPLEHSYDNIRYVQYRSRCLSIACTRVVLPIPDPIRKVPSLDYKRRKIRKPREWATCGNVRALCCTVLYHATPPKRTPRVHRNATWSNAYQSSLCKCRNNNKRLNRCRRIPSEGPYSSTYVRGCITTPYGTESLTD